MKNTNNNTQILSRVIIMSLLLLISNFSMSQSRVLSTEAELRREFEIIALADETDDGQRYLTVVYDEVVVFHFLSKELNMDSNIVIESVLVFLSKGAFNNKIGQIMADYYQKSSSVWLDFTMQLTVMIERGRLDNRNVIGYSIDFNKKSIP